MAAAAVVTGDWKKQSVLPARVERVGLGVATENSQWVDPASVTPQHQPRGVFIVVEGIDRAGKTTQCQELVKALNAKWPTSTVYFKFPDRTTETGKMIDTYLKSSEKKSEEMMYMLFATNRFESNDKIKALLKSGTNVVCDRYIASGICYGVAKGLKRGWCIKKEVGLIDPDRCMYIKIDPEVAAKRGGFGAERNDDVKLLEKVVAQFDVGFDVMGLQSTTFDGTKPVADIASQLLESAVHWIETKKNTELLVFGDW